MRIAAVDFGTKRVGLAIADPLRIFAQPEGTYSQDAAVQRLRKWHVDPGLEVVVVGWPLTESGEESAATRRVHEYANRLRNALPGAGIVPWDERWTSEEAKDRLRDLPKRKRNVDAVAAGIILQEYLDERERNTDV